MMLDWKSKISDYNTVNKERYTESINVIEKLKKKNAELDQSLQQEKVILNKIIECF